MKITFSVSAAQLKEHETTLQVRLKHALPDVDVIIEVRKGLLTLDVPEHADPAFATETLRRMAMGLGIALMQPEGDGEGKPLPAPKVREKQEPHSVKMSVVIALLIAVAIFCTALTFGIAVLVFSEPTDFFGSTLGTSEEQEGEDYAAKIGIIDYLFKNYGLYDKDGEILLDEMLRAYAAATEDKYAAYYTAEELSAMLSEMGGNAVGIGVTVTMDPDTGNIYIIQVYPGSPAEKAGVLPGDIVIMIGTKAQGELVSDLGYEVAMRRMAGEAGTDASFVVLRGDKEIEFTVTRAAFIAMSVEGRVSETDASVGIVRITDFDATTPAQFKDAMTKLIGKGCTRFVYDVRNNPGGEQRSVVAVLSYFAKENADIMSTVTKDGTKTVTKAVAVSYTGEYAPCSVKKEEIGMYRDYPVVVLINGHTASAGELFTATLADYGVATLVGVNTYGKGVIQSIFDLSTLGKHYGVSVSGGFKLTVGYYAPASGVNYDGKGIAPHVQVELDSTLGHQNLYLLDESEDNQLLTAIQTVLAK